MDKPKESKVRTRVMEILRNHDQEARVIEAQIAAEKEALEADLEFILESAYPSSPCFPTEPPAGQALWVQWSAWTGPHCLWG